MQLGSQFFESDVEFAKAQCRYGGARLSPNVGLFRVVCKHCNDEKQKKALDTPAGEKLPSRLGLYDLGWKNQQ